MSVLAITAALIVNIQANESKTPWGMTYKSTISGYGIVIGLKDTGDSDIEYAKEVVDKLKSKFNNVIDKNYLKLKQCASVKVTSYISANGKIVTEVSTLKDASSLKDGVLFMTLLTDDKDKVIAITQGPLKYDKDKKIFSPQRESRFL